MDIVACVRQYPRKQTIEFRGEAVADFIASLEEGAMRRYLERCRPTLIRAIPRREPRSAHTPAGIWFAHMYNRHWYFEQCAPINPMVMEKLR